VSSNRHTIVGWLVWQIGKRVVRRKISKARSKLVPLAVVVAVVAAGFWLKAGDES
jgi:hypothetical protein